MAFDDLARHMASRDGKKTSQPETVDQFLAEAAAENRRLDRKRDLILGPVLLIGGLVISIFIALYLVDAINPTPNPMRPPETSNRILLPTGGAVFALGMVVTGLLQTIRGLRGRR
jgi:hypothetical protein